MLYEFRCPKCSKESEVWLTLEELYTADVECADCLVLLEREIRTPTAVNIPMKHQSCPNWNKKEPPRVPIQILDPMPNGKVKITRIGKKTDI